MPSASRRAGRGRRPRWAGLADAELLDLRFCDLRLRIEGTPLADRVERLYHELDAKGIGFRPHVWFSDEWFSPDGIPGIAVPFYLAHPRLAQLERRQVHEVEGGSLSSCMKILRHEAGHALDTAYRLHRRRDWREHFGSFSDAYPEVYQAKPYSRRFVLHLDFWYAQSHPAEDFAETFGVWCRPRSTWRKDYVGWPALRKLECVDRLMASIRGKKPLVRTRRRSNSVAGLRKTLREHYRDKRDRYGVDRIDFYDRELKRLFSVGPAMRGAEAAADFLERIRPEVRSRVARWTEQYRYTIDEVLDQVIERCAALDLYRASSERRARTDAMIVLTVITMNYLNAGHHRVVL